MESMEHTSVSRNFLQLQHVLSQLMCWDEHELPHVSMWRLLLLHIFSFPRCREDNPRARVDDLNGLIEVYGITSAPGTESEV